jgi:hypothetical protein
MSRCEYCNKIIINKKFDRLCNNCFLDENIMILSSDIRKLYRLNNEDMNSQRMNLLFNAKTERCGDINACFYIEDVHKLAKRVAEDLPDNDMKKKAFEKQRILKEQKDIKQKKEQIIYDTVYENIISSLPKYNVPLDFFNLEYTNELFNNFMTNMFTVYEVNVNSLTVEALEFLVQLYDKKKCIDSKLEKIMPLGCIEETKNHEKYIQYMKDNISLIDAVNFIKTDNKLSDVIVRREEYIENIGKYILNKLHYCDEKAKNSIKLLESKYVEQNNITIDKCIHDTQSIFFDCVKFSKITKIREKINRLMKSHYSFDDLESLFSCIDLNCLSNATTTINNMHRLEKKILCRCNILIDQLKLLLNNYDDIKQYLYDFINNQCDLIVSNDICEVCYLNFNNINDINNSIKYDIDQYVINGKPSFDKTITNIENKLEQIRIYTVQSKKNMVNNNAMIQFIKGFNSNANNSVVQYIKTTDEFDTYDSFEQKLRKIKKYYFWNCMYTDDKYKIIKEKFILNYNFLIYLDNVNCNFEYVENCFSIFVIFHISSLSSYYK